MQSKDTKRRLYRKRLLRQGAESLVPKLGRLYEASLEWSRMVVVALRMEGGTRMVFLPKVGAKMNTCRNRIGPFA